MLYRQCFALWLLHAASQDFHFCNSFRKLQQLHSCDLHQKTDNVRAAAVILSHMHIFWCAPEPRAYKTSYNVLTETYNLASIFVIYILMLYCAGALLCGYLSNLWHLQTCLLAVGLRSSKLMRMKGGF